MGDLDLDLGLSTLPPEDVVSLFILLIFETAIN